MDVPTGPMELRLPAIKGIGGAALYLIDRFEEEKIFNFREIRYFDIQGAHTGLTSRTMTAPDGTGRPDPNSVERRIRQDQRGD